MRYMRATTTAEMAGITQLVHQLERNSNDACMVFDAGDSKCLLLLITVKTSMACFYYPSNLFGWKDNSWVAKSDASAARALVYRPFSILLAYEKANEPPVPIKSIPITHTHSYASLPQQALLGWVTFLKGINAGLRQVHESEYAWQGLL